MDALLAQQRRPTTTLPAPSAEVDIVSSQDTEVEVASPQESRADGI